MRLIAALLILTTTMQAQNSWFSANSLLVKNSIPPVLNLPLCGNSPCGGTPTTSTSALDISGNNYTFTWNGTAAGGVASTYYSSTTGGQYAYAGFFNGTNNYLTRANTSALKPSFPFTFCVAIYVTGAPASGENIYLSDTQTNYAGFGITFNTSGEAVATIGNNGGVASSNRFTVGTTTAIPYNQWDEFCAVFVSVTSTIIYINNIRRTVSTSGTASSMVYTANASSIGEPGFNGGTYFSGLIGPVEIWNYAAPPLTYLDVPFLFQREDVRMGF